MPDYHEVIKKPMDLNTMLKKLRAFVYKSRNDFEKDLQLIYENCYTYNSDTVSLYISLLGSGFTLQIGQSV